MSGFGEGFTATVQVAQPIFVEGKNKAVGFQVNEEINGAIYGIKLPIAHKNDLLAILRPTSVILQGVGGISRTVFEDI
jgi:hypothetical protein